MNEETKNALKAIRRVFLYDGHGDGDECPHYACTDDESCSGGDECQIGDDDPRDGCKSDSCFMKAVEEGRDALKLVESRIATLEEENARLKKREKFRGAYVSPGNEAISVLLEKWKNKGAGLIWTGDQRDIVHDLEALLKSVGC